MKKILGLAVAAMMVMAMVGTGTWAFFSDTETLTGNSLTAGILDLTLGGTVVGFTATDMVPAADPGNPTARATTTLTNATGGITADLSIAISNLVNDENGATSPEQRPAVGDTADDGVGYGELGAQVEMAIYLDPSGDGFNALEDYYLPANGGAAVVWSSGNTVPESAWATIDSFATATWDDTEILFGNPSPHSDLAADEVVTFVIMTRWIESGIDDNIAQSDIATFNVTFTLDQQ